MPPQLHCLNTMRNLVSKPCLRMQFSTTRATFVEYTSPYSIATNRDSRWSEHSTIDSLILNAKQHREQIIAQTKSFAAEKKQKAPTPEQTAQEVADYEIRGEITKQIARRWQPGDIYSPHDLTGVEMAKWKKRERQNKDVFDVLGYRPDQGGYKHFSIMSEYSTAMGRIRGSRETGLRPVNQRRIAKAIRRSVGMGLMPSVHAHPMIIHKFRARPDLYSPYKPGPN